MSLLALKAEVHLGKELKTQADELNKLVRKLQVTYDSYIDSRKPDSGFELDRKDRKVLWSKPTDDTYDQEVIDLVSKIEYLSRRYL